ncbi:MAG: PAS domain S-box protein [candidate division Zixibacteria bacterium]|nr:PAS domain S-box protein [candidate division Zixibacteria bacterium]
MEERDRLDISEEQLEGFTESFASFNKITQKLHSAYKNLEEKFEDLNLKLEKTNRELRQSLAEKDKISNYLNNILESLTSGVVAINLKGEITLFNRAAEEILGYKTDEVLGRKYGEIMGKEVKEKMTLSFTLKSKRLHINEEKEVLAKGGKKIPLGFSTSLLTDGDNHILGAVEVFFDLSKLKELEEEVTRVRTLAALGEMAATVAHEVKNPLGGIRGFADLLDRDLEEGDPRKKSVEKIMEGIETLDKIVLGLLNYTKPIKLDLHQVEFISFMDEVIKFFEIDLEREKKKIDIVRKYPERTLLCRIDPEQFRQVILNLLHNATQAMPHGGRIMVQVNEEREGRGTPQNSLRIHPEAKKIVLKISDTGTGMSKATLDKLFTPFFTTKEHGTGLGLSTVKRIVEAHRGDIRVESEIGKGTTVFVSLPLV